MAIKKLLVYGLPRTGTSVIQAVIADQILQLPNRGEPFSQLGRDLPRYLANTTGTDSIYQWTQEVTDGVFKFLSSNRGQYDLARVLSMGFDHVTVIRRNDHVGSLLSQAHANASGCFHYQGKPKQKHLYSKLVKKIPFSVSRQDGLSWMKNYFLNLQGIEIIERSGLDWESVDYEKFIDTGNLTVAGIEHVTDWSGINTIPLCIDYRSLCTNLEEVESLLGHWLSRCDPLEDLLHEIDTLISEL
jgi:hypothetical protein